jgi:hypothetical protein
MSAWIVSKKHIDTLVLGLIERELIQSEQADEIGLMLWRENHRSVNARYGETSDTPNYTYSKKNAEKLSAVALRKQISCYDYQSCETSDYSETASAKMVRKLWDFINAHETSADEDGNFTDPHEKAEYERATWGV